MMKKNISIVVSFILLIVFFSACEKKKDKQIDQLPAPFVCFKCFSQNSNVWDYKERLFVEKKHNVYILEWFHHKVEMTTV